MADREIETEATRDGASKTAPRSSPSFAAGDLIAGRYRVIRLAGEGGMGEVYEAEDLLLRERVALKTVRPHVACDERVIQRFKREIQLARRVTHPHVCRIFDVGLHRPAGGARDVVFLTMELLDGETLADRLARGRLPLAEAAAFVAQVGAGLDAAHQAGVVHRDFKPGNVVLVGGRAVITDFGLARGAARGTDPTVTGDGGVVGSPSYMAPEQVEGKEVTAAADIYALGVVMYEMVTGRLPFVADNPLSTAMLRLTEDPVTPAAHAVGLPLPWERAILACMRRAPDERPASARAVALAIGGPVGPPRARRRVAMAVVAVVAVAAAAAAFLLWRPTRSPIVTDDGSRRAVAVMGMKNLTARAGEGWIAGALVDMMVTELSVSADIRTISGEAVARARRELALGDEVSYAPDTLARLHTMLGADYVLSGSYMALGKEAGGRLRLDLKLVDVTTGDTIAALSQTGSEADLTELASATGQALRSRLLLAELSPAAREGLRAALPRPDVARLYAEGMGQLRVAACSAARGPLELAVATDPSYPLAHSALAEALSCLGLDERALTEARRAVELAASLPEQIRLPAEARLYQISKQPDKALLAYEKLFARFPDNFDYGIQLAMLQLRTLRQSDVARTVAALRRLPPPLGDSPRLDIIDAYLDVFDGRSVDALARAEEARSRAERQGARLVAADALVLEARVHATADDAEPALAAVEKARAIYEAAGDLDGIAVALSIEATVHQGTGDVEGVHKAESQVMGIARDLGNAREVMRFKLLLAQRMAALGDLSAALAAYAEAGAIARDRDDRELLGQISASSSWLDIERADLDGATRKLEAALVPGLSGDTRAMVLQSLAEVNALRGDAGAAEARLGEAEQVADARGSAMAVVSVERALIYDDQERYAEAEKLARAAEPNASLFAPLARLALARALVGQKRHAEARAVLDGLSRSPYFNGVGVDLLIAPVDAAARAGMGELDQARKDLGQAAARADEHGFLLSGLSARLELAQLEVEHGDAARGQALLAEVATAADARGFVHLARRARRGVQ